MSLSRSTPLKRLTADLLPGMPVSSAWLAQRGVSPQLAYRYVKSGWLARLARGVFAKPGNLLDRDHSLRLLVELGYTVHVGGKTALAWHGFRYNLLLGSELLTLYKHGGRSLPRWFTTRFRCRVTSRLLFDESFEKLLHVTPTNPEHAGVPVSEPERAALEMLSEIPRRQDVEEAEQLMESLVSLRRDVMRDLLMHCKSVKTVRLLLHFSRKLNLPVLENLPVDQLPTGSKSRYVRKLPHGTLVLKQ